jgi:hypothetical protein
MIRRREFIMLFGAPFRRLPALLYEAIQRDQLFIVKAEDHPRDAAPGQVSTHVPLPL